MPAMSAPTQCRQWAELHWALGITADEVREDNPEEFEAST